MPATNEEAAMKMNRRSATLLLGGAILSRIGAARSAETAKEAPAPAPAPSGPAVLPKDIAWETNNNEPLIGSEKAIKGGRHTVAMGEYPLTFRLVGPNSNSAFAAWNRAFTMSFILVGMHPVTDKFIPIMATHWFIDKDQRTLYFKLDPDARFS